MLCFHSSVSQYWYIVVILLFENGNEKAFLELSAAFLYNTLKREFVAHSALVVVYLQSFCALSFLELGKRSKETFMVKILFSNQEYLIWPMQLVTA